MGSGWAEMAQGCAGEGQANMIDAAKAEEIRAAIERLTRGEEPTT